MIMPIKPATFPLTKLPAAPVTSTTSAPSIGSTSVTSTHASPFGTSESKSKAPNASTGTATAGNAVTGNQAESGTSSDFGNKLREVLAEANEPQLKAEQASQDYANGKQNDLHGTMITMTEADVSLRLVSNVRNRVIEAYREVMRMGS